MAETPRVLVIGLDGATFDVLLPLAERGKLPNLNRLMENGSWGRLESTIPPFTGAAWSTFATGQNPGQHGIISFLERDAFNYETSGKGLVDSRRLKNTLWENISEHRKTTAVINVPLTYPPRPVNGYMVTGMLTPRGAKDYTYPLGLSETLGDDYLVDLNFLLKDSQFRSHGFPAKTEILANIREMSKARAKACLKMIEEKPWDFFMVVFTGTDRLGHFLWDEMESISQGDEVNSSQIHKDILSYLHELDEAIGQLVASFGEEAVTFILSDHGFGPSPTRRVYLNIWLERLGLLKRRERVSLFDLEYWRVRVGKMDRVKGVIRQLIPERTQTAIRDVSETASVEIIDWSSTKAYWVPLYFHVCGIELNVVGKKREGIVNTGEEYERIRETIIDEAQRLLDPANGKAVVEKAVKREDIYSGPNVERFPDVILIFKPEYISGGSLAGSSLAESAAPSRPGEHRQDGIFVANGPSVASAANMSDLSLVDVPPTLLYSMDLPVPSNYDGRVLSELFDPEHFKNSPVVYVDIDDEKTRAEPEEPQLSEEEEAELRQRLRGLGYIE